MRRKRHLDRKSLPYLIIPIETKVRELHAKFYMACVAAERGFGVIFGGSNIIRNRMAWFPRGAIFLDKSVAPSRAGIFRAYRNLGLRVVAWCEEGLAFIDPNEYLRRKVDRHALAQTECFFAWGPYQANLIRRHAPELASRIIETGNPRIDLLSHNLRPVFQEEAQHLRAVYPGLILVNTNFSLCNHKEGDGAFLAGLKAAGKVKSPEEEKFIQGWVEYKKDLFNAFMEMIPALSEQFPKQVIVIRPHPSENHATWKRVAELLPNVKVVHEGNIIPWLLAARVVLHNGCTTGLEGYLLGRSVIAYQPLTSDVYDTHLPNLVSVRVTILPDLLAVVRRSISEECRIQVDEAHRVLKTYLHHVEGGCTDELVNHLWVHCQTASSYTFYEKCLCLARRWVWRVRMNRQTKHLPTAYQAQKFPGLTAIELTGLLNNFQRVTGRFQELVIEEKWPGCFVLHPST